MDVGSDIGYDSGHTGKSSGGRGGLGGGSSAVGGRGGSTGDEGNIGASPARRQARICKMAVVVGPSLVERYGSVPAAAKVVIAAIIEVDAIYRATDFDGDGRPGEVGVVLEKMFIYETEKSPGFRLANTDDMSNSELLDTFRRYYTFPGMCASIFLHNRDRGRIKGLAWTRTVCRDVGSHFVSAANGGGCVSGSKIIRPRL